MRPSLPWKVVESVACVDALYAALDVDGGLGKEGLLTGKGRITPTSSRAADMIGPRDW